MGAGEQGSNVAFIGIDPAPQVAALNHQQRKLPPSLTDLSQFAVIPQAKYLKTGEAEAKVFTTAKAGWRARFLEVQGCVAP